MKSKSIFIYLILIISITICKDNKKKKSELAEEKIEKKSKKNKEKNYVIKTNKSQEEMNKIFSGSSLEDLKTIEKNKKLDKKAKKENRKEDKKHFVISNQEEEVIPIEEEDDDDYLPFDDFLLREVDYIDDTQINKMNTNLLKVNDNNIKETSYNNFRVGYAFLYFLFIICFILFSFHALYSKKEIVEKEFILESDKMDSYLLNDSNYL